MTPGIQAAKKAKITYKIHEYVHDKQTLNFGEEAAIKMDVDASCIFKTLMVSVDDGKFALAILPVSSKLNMKKIARAAKSKKAKMAVAQDVERTSGYVLGGVSPLGQKKRVETFIDVSAQALVSIFVSAGKRGLEIELQPGDLSHLTQAHFVDLCT